MLALEAGCMMGPKYKRPAVDVPQQYRAPAPEQAAQASSLGNEQWWQVYQDPVLTQLIHKETMGTELGFLGTSYIDVLQLNEALVKLEK